MCDGLVWASLILKRFVGMLCESIDCRSSRVGAKVKADLKQHLLGRVHATMNWRGYPRRCGALVSDGLFSCAN